MRILELRQTAPVQMRGVRGSCPVAGIPGGACQAAETGHVVWVNGKRFLEARQCFVIAFEFLEGIAALAQGVGIAGSNRERSVVFGDCLFATAERCKRVPEIDARVGVVRPDGQRFVIMDDRLLGPC